MRGTIDVSEIASGASYGDSWAPGVKNNVKPPKHDAVPVPDNRSPLTNNVNVELGPDGTNVNARLTEIGEVACTVTAAVVFGTAAFATVPISNLNAPVPLTMH